MVAVPGSSEPSTSGGERFAGETAPLNRESSPALMGQATLAKKYGGQSAVTRLSLRRAVSSCHAKAVGASFSLNFAPW